MKKTLVKAFAMSAIAIALVVASVLGTMAYLTSSSAVSNVFTIGNVGIQMFESKVNSDGQILKPDGSLLTDTAGNPVTAAPSDYVKTADGNSYHLLPGKKYIKDPTIYVNAGSAPSFLFLKVRNDLLTIEEGYNPAGKENPGPNEEAKFGPTTMRAQLEANGWKFHHQNDTTGVRVYILCHTAQTTSDSSLVGSPRLVGGVSEEVIPTFGNFTIDDKATDAQLSLFGGARVDLVAYAIQADTFSDDPGVTDIEDAGSAVSKAWKAIVETYPYENVSN